MSLVLLLVLGNGERVDRYDSIACSRFQRDVAMVCLCDCSARTADKAKPMHNYSVIAAALRQTSFTNAWQAQANSI